jgi:formylglycine-generating enzyme
MLLPMIALIAATTTSSMARIPAGTYQPLYGASSSARIAVDAFRLDRDVVTRGQFSAFVRANPSWRRSVVRRTLADTAYLSDWKSDLDAGAPDAAVTGVSWFAARAYCAAEGKRLPTVDEWEYVAAADAHRRDASNDPSFRAAILVAYGSRASGRTSAAVANVYGVRGLHDRVWEWTLDFNASVAGAAHHHHEATHQRAAHDPFCAGAASGATDPSNYPAFMRFAVRSSLTPRTTLSGLGFRCASS